MYFSDNKKIKINIRNMIMLIIGSDSANNKRKSFQYVIINPLLEKAREKYS